LLINLFFLVTGGLCPEVIIKTFRFFFH
jgi:hypothetical protein